MRLSRQTRSTAHPSSSAIRSAGSLAGAIGIAALLSGCASTSTSDEVGTAPPPPTTAPQPMAGSAPEGAHHNYQQPAWTDLSGWAREKSYSTIQTADFDGDGQPELWGRSAQGVSVWSFSPQSEKCGLTKKDGAGNFLHKPEENCGVWLPVGERLGLSDEEGWDFPAYYKTLQSADVDGVKGDELLARAKNGLHVWKFDMGTGKWSALSKAGTAEHDPRWLIGALANRSDLDGCVTDFTQPQYYETIQTADLDGDRRAEVFARLCDGIHAWKLGEDDTFRQLPVLRVAGSSWGDVPAYYETIQAVDLGGSGHGILARAADGLHAWVLHESKEHWVEAGAVVTELADARNGGKVDLDSPHTYKTIQAADLNGDGSDELLAMLADGLHTWTWDGGWRPSLKLPKVGGGGPYQEGSGWGCPCYYRTVQAADVDGEPGAEIMARASDGLHTWKLDEGKKEWLQVGAPIAELADSNNGGWVDRNGPQYYETVQTAPYTDSEGNRRALLLARKNTGMVTFAFDASARSWARPTATFPAFEGKALDAYRSISRQLTDNSSSDIRGLYDRQATLEYSSSLRCSSPEDIAACPVSCTDCECSLCRPQGLTTEEFSPIFLQIQAELEAVNNVKDSFQSIHDHLIEPIFVTEGPLLGAVSDQLKAEANAEEAQEQLEARPAEIMESVLGALSAFPEVGEVAGLAGDLIGLAMTAQGGAESWPATLNAEMAKLESRLVDQFQDSSFAEATASIVFDYGLLRAVSGLTAGKFDPSDNQDKAIAAAQRQYELLVWQSLTPAVWSVRVCDLALNSDTGNFWYECVMGDPFQTFGSVQTWVVATQDQTPVDTSRFFLPTSADCKQKWSHECGFGLPEQDKAALVRGEGNWQLGCAQQLVGLREKDDPLTFFKKPCDHICEGCA